MEVSGSSIILSELAVSKDEVSDENAADATASSSPIEGLDPIPVILNAAEVPETTESAQSTAVLDLGLQKNFQQGITNVEGTDIADENELKDGKQDQSNGFMDFDLLDLIANPAERVKSDTMRRKRKQVNLFVISVPEEKPPMVVANGQGCQLGEIPSIETQINKRPYSDLVRLHRFLFGKGGSQEEVKNNLKLFSGFPFSKESDDYKKKREVLIKMNEIVRDILCDCLTLSKEYATEIMDENLMSFLLKPASTSEALKLPLAVTAELNETRRAVAPEQVESAAATSKQGESAAATSKQGESTAAPSMQGDSITASEQGDSTGTSCKHGELTANSEQTESLSGTSSQEEPVAKPKKQGKAKAATPRKPKVSAAKPDQVETKPAAGKPRKVKPKSDKENSKPVKDPPKRKRKGFMAPVTDKSQPAKKVKSANQTATLATVISAQ
ncbi:unnamed protein product [Orchesella dallaii]|uniref:Uncharacterized protein n=1 Tax=Orchesella dallaii TaxID=48710 RepID=A0ABP1QFH3_9HEXA